MLALLTVFETLFPNVGLNFEYKHLPIEFEVESVSDIYVPAYNNANAVEYPLRDNLKQQIKLRRQE